MVNEGEEDWVKDREGHWVKPSDPLGTRAPPALFESMAHSQQAQQAATGLAGTFSDVGTFTLQHDGNNNFRIAHLGPPPGIVPVLNGNAHGAGPIAAAQNNAGHVRTNFDPFFTNIGAVATLGTSISFALIVSQLQDPLAGVAAKRMFDLSTVRIFIAVGWLLFTITLVLSFLLSASLKWWMARPNSSATAGYCVTGLLYLLMAGAFLCLSLAVAAYVDAVGFTAAGIIGAIIATPFVVAVLSLCWGGVQWIKVMFAIGLTAGP
jgi:hypothetical protein